jgi:fucose 4-O-acetylase-like acetyltransferase
MKMNIKKAKNYGIAILRVLLSFMVVLDHFYSKRKYLLNILYYHIPTFFVLSFYFTYHTFATYNISKIKLRFERIVIPYFVWSVICWLLFNISTIINSKGNALIKFMISFLGY